MASLEVIAHDLLELLASPVEPVGEALVQLRAKLLRDPLVGGVADQHVPEAERVLDRLVRADELLAHERRELRAAGRRPVRRRARRVPPIRTRGRRRKRARAASRSSSGSASRRAARSAWIVERHPLGVAPLGDHCQHLFDEERISLGHLPDPRARLRSVEPASRRAAPRSARRTPPVRAAASVIDDPVHAGRASISSGRARQRSRSGASRVQSTRCSIRSSSVGSAQWMSSTTSDERALARATARAPCGPTRRSPPARPTRAPPRARRSRPRLAEDLDEWPVGDAFAVRKAAAGEDGRFARQLCRHLAGEARLADPRGPEHRDEPAAPLEHGLVEGRRGHAASSSPAPDERRVEPPLEGRRALDRPAGAGRPASGSAFP